MGKLPTLLTGPQIRAAAELLAVDIVVLDEGASWQGQTLVPLFAPGTRVLNRLVTWASLLPRLQSQRDAGDTGRRLIVLFWTMQRRHYQLCVPFA